jgi:hypothetical protein
MTSESKVVNRRVKRNVLAQSYGADDICAAHDCHRFLFSHHGNRLILCVVISRAMSSTGISSLTLMTFLLMIA